MVAKENNALVEVPPLRLETEEDVRRFADVIYRKGLKKYYRDQEKIPYAPF
jgi:hypothetical protein